MNAKTRLAPSPTGALHLGNVRTFLINWAVARQAGWRLLLRIEDLDGPRIRPKAASELIDLLRWLGLDWDEGPIYQSHESQPYREALAKLGEQGKIYPCGCTRSQIESNAVSAPHGDENELRYSGTCRPTVASGVRWDSREHEGVGWRIRVDSTPVRVEDQFAGHRSISLVDTCGDFLLVTKEGLPSYQLAVVVGDARQGVTHIVRGDDLLPSAARQQFVRNALGLDVHPLTWHAPLVRGPDGKRLAKRHGDTRLAHYRQQGVTPERVIGLVAAWCGILPRRAPRTLSLREFQQEFAWEKLPRGDVVCSPEGACWLEARPRA